MTVDQQKLDALVGRLFGDLSAGYGGVMVSLGDKLGLYRAMQAPAPSGRRKWRAAAAAANDMCASGSTRRLRAAMWTIIQPRVATS